MTQQRRAGFDSANLVQPRNTAIKHRTGCVGIFLNEAAFVGSGSAILLKQSDGWAVQPRPMTLDGITRLGGQIAR